MADLLPCPFCSKTMMLRSALWPSEGDADAIIHADKTDCPMFGFGDGSADGSIVEKWNICSSDDEDYFPSDGSCIRCGSVPRNANGLCNTCLDEDAERLENTRHAPAATDTGLETVAWYHPEAEWASADREQVLNHCQKEGPQPQALCHRSQAEDLLAAEHEGKRFWQNEYTQKCKLLLKAEADNAALTARVEELADERYKLAYAITGGEDAPGYLDSLSVETLVEVARDNARRWFAEIDRAEALEAKLAAAQKALEPFADHANDRAVDDTGWRDKETVKIVVSIGDLRKARAVLGGKPS